MPQPNSSTQTDDFDLQAWLADITAEGSLSQEEVKSLGTILGSDKVKTKLRDQVLMRRDYSRKTQELADQRRQLEADVDEILTERRDLATWKSGIDDKLKKAYSDLESERTTTAQFRTRIQSIAEQSGLDVSELLQGLPAATTATSTAVRDAANNGGAGAGNGNGGGGNGGAALDPTNFVSTEDFSKFARTSPLLSAELFDLTQEHQELFGKPFRMEYTDAQGRKFTGTRALVVKAAEYNARNPRSPRSIRETWEGEFKVPEARDNQLRESIRNEEHGKLEAEFKTKLSEQLVNGGTPGRTIPLADRPKSVLFDEKRDQRTPAEREAATGTTGGGDNGHRTTEPPPTTAAHETTRWEKAASSFLARRAQGVPMGQEAPAGKTGL